MAADGAGLHLYPPAPAGVASASGSTMFDMITARRSPSTNSSDALWPRRRVVTVKVEPASKVGRGQCLRFGQGIGWRVDLGRRIVDFLRLRGI